MPDAPLLDSANLFIWIVCILVGFSAALILIDNLPKKKKENSEGH
ncbi:MAG TPA: hypothetical protein VI583_13765 [Cyclobacteriaceae bacterium]|nr:hypothetical protein [Cyclobacteriaceae bacterium]